MRLGEELHQKMLQLDLLCNDRLQMSMHNALALRTSAYQTPNYRLFLIITRGLFQNKWRMKNENIELTENNLLVVKYFLLLN